jgi:hypothetical protein
MTPEEKNDLERELRELKRRYNDLKLTKARYGFSTPTHVNLELEDTAKEIKAIEHRLATEPVVAAEPDPELVHTLSAQQLNPLVQLLEQFPSFSDMQARSSVIAELSYQKHIKLGNVLRHDAIQVLRTGYRYQNGLQELASALELFDGDSMILKKFREHIDQLTQS